MTTVTVCKYTNMSVYIKNFVLEDQRQKRHYIVHNIAPQGTNSAILFVYRIRYAYGKEPEGFQKVFHQSRQTWYV